jgi:hypothetical protein
MDRYCAATAIDISGTLDFSYESILFDFVWDEEFLL